LRSEAAPFVSGDDASRALAATLAVSGCADMSSVLCRRDAGIEDVLKPAVLS